MRFHLTATLIDDEFKSDFSDDIEDGILCLTVYNSYIE